MPTNMTIFKSPEYSYLWICNIGNAKVLDRVCACSKLNIQSESNKHHIKTRNKKIHRTKIKKQNKQIRANTTKSQKQTKEY